VEDDTSADAEAGTTVPAPVAAAKKFDRLAKLAARLNNPEG
jgi:hypothetical protein